MIFFDFHFVSLFCSSFSLSLFVLWTCYTDLCFLVSAIVVPFSRFLLTFRPSLFKNLFINFISFLLVILSVCPLLPVRLVIFAVFVPSYPRRHTFLFRALPTSTSTVGSANASGAIAALTTLITALFRASATLVATTTNSAHKESLAALFDIIYHDYDSTKERNRPRRNRTTDDLSDSLTILSPLVSNTPHLFSIVRKAFNWLLDSIHIHHGRTFFPWYTVSSYPYL